jgi:hypothetical protein
VQAEKRERKSTKNNECKHEFTANSSIAQSDRKDTYETQQGNIGHIWDIYGTQPHELPGAKPAAIADTLLLRNGIYRIYIGHTWDRIYIGHTWDTAT